MAAQESGRARELAHGKTVSDLAAPLLGLRAGLLTLEAQPLLSSVARFAGKVGREGVSGAVADAGTNELVSGFVPTLLRQATALLDNTVRENRADPMAGISSDIPGGSTQFPPRYDVLGEAQQRYQYGTNTLVNVLLNPAFVSRVNSDPLLKELDSLYERTGEGGVLLRQAGRTLQVNGKTVELTNEQRSAYQQFIGRVSSSVLRELIASPAYASAPDDTRAKVASARLQGAASAGKIMLLGQRVTSRPDMETIRAMMHARALGYSAPQ